MEQTTQETVQPPNEALTPKSFRDERGLVTEATYKFKPDGSVDWREMVNPSFLYPDEEYFNSKKMEVPESIEGLTDNQLLLRLAGLKELARLRGFKSVKYDLNFPRQDYVVAKCTITWLGNFETSFEDVEFEDVGNASFENTNSFIAKFLETIAVNRAFVRCVRNFLNVNITGADEIDKSRNKKARVEENAPEENLPTDISPQGLLRKRAKDKISCEDFEGFKDYLRKLWKSEQYMNEDVSTWTDFSSIPPKECRKLMTFLK